MLRPHIPHGMWPVPATDHITFEVIHGPTRPGDLMCTEAEHGACTTGAPAQPYVSAPDDIYGGRAACVHHWVRFDAHPH